MRRRGEGMFKEAIAARVVLSSSSPTFRIFAQDRAYIPRTANTRFISAVRELRSLKFDLALAYFRPRFASRRTVQDKKRNLKRCVHTTAAAATAADCRRRCDGSVEKYIATYNRCTLSILLDVFHVVTRDLSRETLSLVDSSYNVYDFIPRIFARTVHPFRMWERMFT